jgi:hypothetical protein
VYLQVFNYDILTVQLHKYYNFAFAKTIYTFLQATLNRRATACLLFFDKNEIKVVQLKKLDFKNWNWNLIIINICWLKIKNAQFFPAAKMEIRKMGSGLVIEGADEEGGEGQDLDAVDDRVEVLLPVHFLRTK